MDVHRVSEKNTVYVYEQAGQCVALVRPYAVVNILVNGDRACWWSGNKVPLHYTQVWVQVFQYESIL